MTMMPDFLRRRDPLEETLAAGTAEALFAPPLLERRRSETETSLKRLRADKALVEREISDLQEELRQITVAIAADEAAAMIIADGRRDTLNLPASSAGDEAKAA